MNTKVHTQPTNSLFSFVILFLSIIILVNCSPTSSSGSSPSGGGEKPPVVESQPTSPPSRPNTAVEQGSGSFSMATASTERPSNVMQKIKFFQGGGGGRCNGTETQPTMMYGESSYEIMPTSRTQIGTETIFFISCGWTSTGRLPVIITNPDGSQDSYTTSVQVDDMSVVGEGLYADFEVKLGNSPTLGNYEIAFKGKSGSARQSFAVTEPKGPRLYILNNGDVILWNFLSNENIWLFAYEDTSSGYDSTGEYIAYKQYQADADGNLYIDVSGSFDVLMALGEYSGEVENFGGYRFTDGGFSTR